MAVQPMFVGTNERLQQHCVCAARPLLPCTSTQFNAHPTGRKDPRHAVTNAPPSPRASQNINATQRKDKRCDLVQHVVRSTPRANATGQYT